MISIKKQGSLRSRIIGASLWVLSGHVVGQAMRLGGNLIMTRLLVPEMFGVMAIANIFLVGLALFSDLGLRQNIIQSNRGDDPAFLNTIWVVQIIRGGIIWLAGLGLGIAFHIMNTAQLLPDGSVYADPILPYVITAISFNALVNGFESTKMATANRDLTMRVLTNIELLSQLTGLVVMIAWALIDRSIWALVIGSIIGNMLKVVLSHAWIPGISNQLRWDRASFIDIFNFGKWIFLTSIIGFLVNSGDTILLGGLVEAKILGIYVIAFFLVNAITQILNKIIGSVMYPVLSKFIREKNKDIKRTYYRLRLPIDIVSLLSAGFLFSSGSLIVEILYDDRYMAAGHMLEVLCITLIGIRYRAAEYLFMAMGKPNLLIPTILPRLLALYILLPIAFKLYGLDGALWIAGGSILFSLPVIFYLKVKYSIFDMAREIRVLPLLGVGYALGLLVTSIYIRVIGS